MGTVGRKVAAAAAAGVLLGTLAACGSGGSGTSRDAAGSPAAAPASPGGSEGTAAAASGTASSAPTGSADPGAASGAASGSPGGTPSAGTATGGATTGGGTGGATGGTAGATTGGASGGAATAGAAGTAAGAGTAGTAGGGAQPAAGPDSDTLLLDDRLVLQVLPDQKAIPGWEEEKRKVDTADHATTCTAATPCTGKPLSGSGRFASGEVTARFAVDTLAGKAEAKERLKEAYAAYGDGRYSSLDLGVLGTESRAFQGQIAGRDGVSIVLRSGTVVASVTTEGGPVDPAGARRLAAMLVKRIEQAQAGRTPDAVLDPA
ncbi:hypothetical protein [Kitasatospora sp. NBC_00458]|uniref:hypothetical protein n=1 Tax=Kitasatospora sp. NBC_00458 TaxID=2903568 RepID=UPI002E1923AC